jgi:O-antigen/teichoic acid export membrane protein
MALLETIKGVAKDTAIYGLGGVAARFASFFLIPLYTRFLSPAEFGILSIILVLPALLSEIANAGIIQGFYRLFFDIPEGRETTIDTATWFSLIAAAAFLILVLPTAPLIAKALLGNSSFASLFRLSAVVICLGNLTRLGLALLRVERRVKLFTLINVMRICASLGVTIYLVGSAGRGISGVLLGQIAAEFLALIVLIGILANRIRMMWSSSRLREMLKYSLPLLPAGVAAWATLSLPVVLVGRLASMDEAGLYGLASRLTWMISVLIVTPFLMGWDPIAFALAKSGDPRPIYARMFTYLAVLSSWAGLALAIAGESIIRLLTTHEFAGASDVVPILAVGVVLYGLASFLFVQLKIAKRTPFIALVWCSTAIVCVVLSLLLIPKYGRFGAAIAYALAFAVSAFLSYLLSQKTYWIKLEHARLLKAGGIALLLYVISSFIEGMTWLALLTRLALIGSFPILLYLTGFLLKEEEAAIRSVLRRSR